MDTPKPQQERSIELRSEKVRSLVGQIPSSLTRYGIAVIAFVLLCLVSVAYFIPYKEVYSGVVIIHQIEAIDRVDSIDVPMLLKFEVKRPAQAEGSELILYGVDRAIASGQMQRLSSRRDTLDRQEAICRFAKKDVRGIEAQSVDFRLVRSSGSLLSKMLGDMGIR